MSKPIRQSTERIVRVGPVVAVGDGFTPITTLDVSTADEAELLKSTGGVVDISGATFAAIATADGYYNLTLTTSLTDTVGPLTVLINDDSLCLPVKEEFDVIEENVYDAIYAGSAAIGTDTGRLTAVRAAILTDWINGGRLDLLLDAIKVPTDKLTFTTANKVDSRVDNVAGTAQTAGDLAALLTTLDTVADGIQTDLSNGTDGLGALMTLIDALNDLSAANILTQVNAALDAAIPELGVAVPTATPSIRTGLILLYMALRNLLNVQTSGTDALEIHNNAGTKITKKLLTDDGSDYSEAKMS